MCLGCCVRASAWGYFCVCSWVPIEVGCMCVCVWISVGRLHVCSIWCKRM